MNPPSPKPTTQPSPGASSQPGRTLWPFGIVAAFVIFIAATIALIAISLSQRDDLVRADYYDHELRFEQELARNDRTREIRSEVLIRFDETQRQIEIGFPARHARLKPTGTIQLYRPSSAGQDVQFELRLDADGRQRIGAGDLSSGLWRVRVHWTVDQADYAVEERLVLPAKSS